MMVTKSLEELTDVSPEMLHCCSVVSSNTTSPSTGLKEGTQLQLTENTTHTLTKRFKMWKRRNLLT